MIADLSHLNLKIRLLVTLSGFSTKHRNLVQSNLFVVLEYFYSS